MTQLNIDRAQKLHTEIYSSLNDLHDIHHGDERPDRREGHGAGHEEHGVGDSGHGMGHSEHEEGHENHLGHDHGSDLPAVH